MSTETTEQKPKLSKHLAAAVNQLEKQLAKHEKKVTDLVVRRARIQNEIDDISTAQIALSEQIKKLKGE